MADYGSGHWYTDEGVAKHWQEDGKKTTLRHARKQNLFPSVSGILGMISNDFLNNWKTENHIRIAYQNKAKKGESEDNYIKRVKGMAYSQQGDILDFGTRTHAAIELINNHYIDEQQGVTGKAEG